MFQRPATAVHLDRYTSSRGFFEPAVKSDGRPLYVAHVDEQARCLHLAPYARSGDHDDVPVAAILRDAAELGSSGIVLAHHHGMKPLPSGAQAWRGTRHLADAVNLIQVTLLDHLVFHGRDCLSLRRVGVL